MLWPISWVITSARFEEIPRKHSKLLLNTTSPSKILKKFLPFTIPPVVADVTPPIAKTPAQLTGSEISPLQSPNDIDVIPFAGENPQAVVVPPFCITIDALATFVQAARLLLNSVTPPPAT